MGRRVLMLAMVGLVTVAMVGLPAFAEGEQQPVEASEVVAAPGVATRLLAAAGMAPNYRQGRVRGNHVADVARAMGPGTVFNGVAASELVAYECAVATFLREGRVRASALVSRQACATVPNPPTGLEVTAGDGQLVVVWKAPVDGGGACTEACDAPVTGYTVTLEPDDAGPITLDAEQLSVVVEGLTNGTTYTVSVVATNRIGDSAAATAEGTPQAGGLRFTAISAGNGHTCAVADATAYCWGFGGVGQLGNGATADQTRPVEVATGDGSALPPGATVTAISAGGAHTCAVADGTAYCWGNGGNGQLGNGTTTFRQLLPVEVATGDGSALPDHATVGMTA
jgi:hypothetical protein